MRLESSQIQIARSVNFINFMLDKHKNLIKLSPECKTYIHPEHDSLKFFEHGFYRFSTNEGGDGIRFLQDYAGLSFQKAVMELYQYADGKLQDKIPTYSRKNSDFEFPKKTNKRFNRVYAYLTITRRIPYETVDRLINENLLYEDVNGNAVFVNQKPSKEIAISRSTVSFIELPFKRIDTSESNNYWIFENQDSDIVYICESPIDAISLYELNGRKSGAYTAMGGIKGNTLKKIISDYPNSKIVLSVDGDKRGRNFANENKKLCDEVLLPDTSDGSKDWNDVLKKKREIKVSPVENPDSFF